MTETKRQVPATIQAHAGTGLMLNSIEDIQRAARLFIASGVFAEKDMERDMAKACIKIIAGQELGLKPFQAMRGIDIVKGQPMFKYQLVGAKIKESGRYDFKPIEVSNTRAAIQFYDHGKPVFLSEFTMEDAKRQELAGKDNYKRIPKDMLYARALTNGANKVCPEIFFQQCYSPEDFGEASGEILPTEADIVEPTSVLPSFIPIFPSREDWHALRAAIEKTGADMFEVEKFIADNKGKIPNATVYERLKHLYCGEAIHDESDRDTDVDAGAELDEGFRNAVDGDN